MGALTGVALLFFVLRAFSSGCTALTGVEAIANGVPAFKKPKSRNAATTLLLMGTLSMGMFLGITALALISDVRYTEHTCDLIGFAGDCRTDPQRTVIAQVAAAVFGGDDNVFFFYLQAATAAILILAANTAFNGFPLLGSILAQDRYMPRQLHTRGDRLVFSNGIVLLAVFAGLLIIAFDASVTRLIQLYIIGVFTSVHPRSDRHGPALEPPAARGDRPRRPSPRAALAGHQRRGRRIHRAGARDRAGDEVPQRGLDRRARHAPAVPDDAKHQPALLDGRGGARRRRGRGGDPPRPYARDRARVEDPQADAARRELRAGVRARRPSRR
jgi:hypothetical protein